LILTKLITTTARTVTNLTRFGQGWSVFGVKDAAYVQYAKSESDTRR